MEAVSIHMNSPLALHNSMKLNAGMNLCTISYQLGLIHLSLQQALLKLFLKRYLPRILLLSCELLT